MVVRLMGIAKKKGVHRRHVFMRLAADGVCATQPASPRNHNGFLPQALLHGAHGRHGPWLEWEYVRVVVFLGTCLVPC